MTSFGNADFTLEHVHIINRSVTRYPEEYKLPLSACHTCFICSIYGKLSNFNRKVKFGNKVKVSHKFLGHFWD